MPISKPLLIGGAVVAVGALILLTSGSSKAAQESPAPGPGPLPPAPRPPEVLPPISGPTGAQTPLTPTATPGLFTSSVTGILLHAAGYNGPGDYEVLAPNGLNMRAQPSASSAIIGQNFWQGTVATVTGPPDANGWVPTTDGAKHGFVCMICPQAPGGPWLARIAE
jgi:uncharacterized protein YgiM (DUF1202 family)